MNLHVCVIASGFSKFQTAIVHVPAVWPVQCTQYNEWYTIPFPILYRGLLFCCATETVLSIFIKHYPIQVNRKSKTDKKNLFTCIWIVRTECQIPTVCLEWYVMIRDKLCIFSGIWNQLFFLSKFKVPTYQLLLWSKCITNDCRHHSVTIIINFQLIQIYKWATLTNLSKYCYKLGLLNLVCLLRLEMSWRNALLSSFI